MKKLRVGIIGLGRIAALYEKDKRAKKYYPYLTHAGSYKKNPNVKIVCGADIDRNKLKKFRGMFGIDNLYTDYVQMLEENELDILSICTPPEKHLEIIRSAAGLVKVIFCEKPFTNGAYEIEEIIGLQKGKNLNIAINVYREYDASHKKVRDIIRSGKFGKVQRVNCFYGKGLRNIGSHILTYLIGVLGAPKKIKVLDKKRYYGVKELTCDVHFEFPDKVAVLLQSCDYNQYRLCEIDFICEKGRIQILNEGIAIRVCEARFHKAEMGARELVEKKGAIKSTIGVALGKAVDHLVDLSLNEAVKPIVSPKRYLVVQKVIEEIERQGKGL